ncbi:MAG: DUF1080 domain-containing protein [Saprospiraceae bacterium]|nr:DUF1080 domain-containing protein [Saprospiraceae bacterium]
MRVIMIVLFFFCGSFNCNDLLQAQIPRGFKSIFNGKNLKGWHISRSSHQGTTPDFKVIDGMITVHQYPFGQGGVLLSDKKYSDFELYLEAKIDSFSNGGIFLRSNEGGAAYQIELDILGGLGDLMGERIQVGVPAQATEIRKVWNTKDWNSIKVKMVGAIPSVALWVNGIKMYEVQQSKNDFIAGTEDGMIGLQCHWTALYDSTAESELMPIDSWRPGALHRFRNIAIKILNQSH